MQWQQFVGLAVIVVPVLFSVGAAVMNKLKEESARRRFIEAQRAAERESLRTGRESPARQTNTEEETRPNVDLRSMARATAPPSGTNRLEALRQAQLEALRRQAAAQRAQAQRAQAQRAQAQRAAAAQPNPQQSGSAGTQPRPVKPIGRPVSRGSSSGSQLTPQQRAQRQEKLEAARRRAIAERRRQEASQQARQIPAAGAIKATEVGSASAPPPPPPKPAATIASILHERGGARRAIILSEILGPPVGSRPPAE